MISEGFTFPTLTEGTDNGKFLDIQFAGTQTLATGVTYAFVLQFDTEATGRLIKLASPGDNPYADGTRIARDFTGTRPAGSTFIADTGSDLVFYVTAVPEPSAAALLALGALSLCVRRR